ncbi:hypothetical protein TVAG_463350 [Trichomonas vaginalis G3]|uniref:Serine/threonine specific protein phosphatases domain-containing protein n=1 Tax=Trichomonas vaginalis (strain ATCC PRA-98 / G3) TaxID=412133 RepID=A2EH07_TRIV3|nr:phosphoprotein phosphatase protein [Trichomonas vaginalis G3]EAY08055.1 hypothetical protein TVAG_463350 [Trichomonas vaginalis G3]KAI5543028.1 phosphoprotein phosphatase protein [Trichomonas vaginalis G3]|eukprot:XP_001320278.1 hypothetical protein [Trichomonas vaginalis G3]
MIKYPSNVHILRGNHKFSVINRVFGFYDEVISKYKDESIWNSFQEVFKFMPLAANISDKIFCVHGGISPLLNSIDDMMRIKRPIESYSDNQLLSDVLWSDPIDSEELFAENRRGLGVRYSIDAVISFLKSNNLSLMIRAHQCVQNGCNLFAEKHGITVFSSGNYNAESPNKSGVVRIPSEREIQMFSLDFTLPINKQENACLFLEDGKSGLNIGEKKFAEFDESGHFKDTTPEKKTTKPKSVKKSRKSSDGKDSKAVSKSPRNTTARNNSDDLAKASKLKIPQIPKSKSTAKGLLLEKDESTKSPIPSALAPKKRVKSKESHSSEKSASEPDSNKTTGIKPFKSLADISSFIDPPPLPPKEHGRRTTRRFSTIVQPSQSSLFEQVLKECSPITVLSQQK